MNIHWMQIFPNSFTTLGVPLLAGRDFNQHDMQKWAGDIHCRREGRQPGEPPPPNRVAIINESMARRFFKNENPIGRLFAAAPLAHNP
jgi:hypothetical protein